MVIRGVFGSRTIRDTGTQMNINSINEEAEYSCGLSEIKPAWYLIILVRIPLNVSLHSIIDFEK